MTNDHILETLFKITVIEIGIGLFGAFAGWLWALVFNQPPYPAIITPFALIAVLLTIFAVLVVVVFEIGEKP